MKQTGNLTPHFTCDETTHSDKADELGIDNTPTEKSIIANIMKTASLMEVVRELLGGPVSINSWYRCRELNVRVGGSATSAHTLGLAVDFVCPEFGSPEEIVCYLSELEYALGFDQLICEYDLWVHIGWQPPGKAARGEVLRAIEGRDNPYIAF